MTRWFAAAALMLLAACPEKTKQAGPPFSGDAFLRDALQITRSNAELGAVAAKRAWAPVTRQLGATVRADQERLHRELLGLAAKRGVKPATAVMQRHVALRENLATLPGQVFDRGYALAMVQEFQQLQRDAERASSSGDAELKRLADTARPRLAAMEKQAQEVLERNGGSPFEF